MSAPRMDIPADAILSDYAAGVPSRVTASRLGIAKSTVLICRYRLKLCVRGKRNRQPYARFRTDVCPTDRLPKLATRLLAAGLSGCDSPGATDPR